MHWVNIQLPAERFLISRLPRSCPQIPVPATHPAQGSSARPRSGTHSSTQFAIWGLTSISTPIYVNLVRSSPE